jgi:uncharacterized membrane protein YphA (DoxX/SURF4 family)
MTSHPTSTDSWCAADVLAVLVRCVLGAVFIYMGMNKALHPVEFLKLVREYDVLHHYLLLNSVAATLPWFEVFCGLLIVLGVAVRGSAAMLLAMLVPFTVLVLLRALSIYEAGGLPFCAIKFDCGCGAGEVLICHKLVENGLLAVVSTWLVFRQRMRLCLRFRLCAEPERFS